MKFNVKFYIHEVCFCTSQERKSSCPHSSVLQSTSCLQEAAGLVQHLQTGKIILILFPVAPKVRLPFMFNVICQCYMNSKSSQIPGEDLTDLTNDPHQTHILVKTCDIDVSHLRACCRSRRSGKSTGEKKNAAKRCIKHGVFSESQALLPERIFKSVPHRLAGSLWASSDTFPSPFFFFSSFCLAASPPIIWKVSDAGHSFNG